MGLCLGLVRRVAGLRDLLLGGRGVRSACSALAFEAKADANAAESKATVVADCARAYFSAFGTLFEGDDVQKQAAQVREQLAGITEQCQAALG